VAGPRRSGGVLESVWGRLVDAASRSVPSSSSPNSSETLAPDRTDDPRPLTDDELDSVAGSQGAHYKTVTLAMRKSAGSQATGVMFQRGSPAALHCLRLSGFPIIAVLAFPLMRRGEVLALRWSALDIERRTLRIERAVEQTSEIRFRDQGAEDGSREARDHDRR
jgi:hypothetical protein